MDEPGQHHDYLRRLAPHYYQGAAWVHWTMSIAGRSQGWLDETMHMHVREALLHTFARYSLVCPAYALMPDHAHFLWCGCSVDSDQRVASSFFRRLWNEKLKARGYLLQKQPHDHVLVETERNSQAFEDTCVYIMRNPERSGLVENWSEWEHAGALVPGYPRLNLAEERFWERFWTAYNSLCESDLRP